MLSEHLATHFERQATEVNVSEKNVSNAPVIMAPITLVATNSIAKSTTEVKTVPRIPVSKTGKIEQIQPRVPPLRTTADMIDVIARYTIAMPKTTHKNAGVTVITAVKRSTAAMIPIMILATTALNKQLFL